MKKLFVLLLCGFLLLCIGCAQMQQEEPATEPVYDLYFRVADLNDAAGADAIAIQRSDIAMNTESEAEALAEQLMSLLLKEPKM